MSRNVLVTNTMGCHKRITTWYSLSLACQSGTDMVHTVGNVTAIVLQFILDQFPSGTFKTAMPSTKLAHRQLRHTQNRYRHYHIQYVWLIHECPYLV